jgi:hypothetical protein
VNLVLSKAFIDDVKIRGEEPDESIIGIDIKLTAEVTPQHLDEFSTELRARLFDNSGAPTITQLGRCHWNTEYEKGEMTIAGIACLNAGMINVRFEPRLNGSVELKVWGRIATTDTDLAGELAGLIKQAVEVSFKKMTQVPLIKAGATPETPAEPPAPSPQGELVETPNIKPLLTTEALKENALSTSQRH